MTQQTQPSGLQIWEKVQTTDPAFTRSFKRPCGFEGTAINPTYLVRKATGIFGPFGIGWGVELISESFVEGHVIGYPAAEGGQPVRSIVHVGRYEIWYELGGKRGSAKHYGQTTFVGKSSSGEIYTNEEAPKMSQTDAMCKALSMLGFGADVHLGLYDDSKYVQDLEAAFAAGLTPTGTTPAGGPPPAAASAPKGEGNKGELSARYNQYKERIRKGSIGDKATAREIIKSDTLLSDFERSMLLSSDGLKQDGEAAHGKQQKRSANEREEAIL